MIELAINREKRRREMRISPEKYNRTYVIYFDMSVAFCALRRCRVIQSLLRLKVPMQCVVAIAKMFDATSFDLGDGIKSFRGSP